jgi:hypothetical protein
MVHVAFETPTDRKFRSFSLHASRTYFGLRRSARARLPLRLERLFRACTGEACAQG